MSKPVNTTSGKRLRRTIGVAVCLALALIGFILWAANPLFTIVDPARPGRGPTVVIVSGDMGFHLGLGPQVGERLVRDGATVVGVNSVHFAWLKRTPREMGDLLTRSIDVALRHSGARQVVLIGQSYGADIVHVGAAHLSAATRAKVAQIVLVVPTRDIFYGVGPLEFLGWRTPDADAVTSATRIDWVPLHCIRGSEETDSVCPWLTRPNVRQTVVVGDHYLGHDADRLYRALRPLIPAMGRI